MSGRNGRSTENEIAIGVMRYLDTVPSGSASIAEIVANLPAHHTLTAADNEQSETRQNEVIWEQQVRNIVSHRQTPGNAIYEGNLVSQSGALELTAKGKQWVANNP